MKTFIFKIPNKETKWHLVQYICETKYIINKALNGLQNPKHNMLKGIEMPNPLQTNQELISNKL